MPDLLTVARWLVFKRRISVLPVDHPDETTQTDLKRIGKVAATRWKEYQVRLPTREELELWFGNGHLRNIGMVTGSLSRLVGVDCDSKEAMAWADVHLPTTPMSTRTARGVQRFYRHPGCIVRNKVQIRTGGAQIEIDVRGDGGYCIAPGSVHATGAVYTRIGPWPPIDQLPLFDPTWLESAASPAPPRQGASAAAHDERVRRARAYLAETPPAIEGQGGDAHTFTLACRLVRGFDLSDARALELLSEWNTGCVPPWSEAELVTKVQGARKYGTEECGWRLETGPDGGEAR